MPGLTVKWRNGVAYATGTVAGKRVRQSLGTRDEGQAEELRAQHEARLWKRHSYGEEAVRTFQEAALSYMEAGGEDRFLEPLIRRFKGRVLGSIKPGEIREAAIKLYPHAKPATRNRQGIVPARSVINHGAALGWCTAIKVANFKVEKARRRAVDRSWVDAFLAQADADNLPGLAAAVLFMWQNGPRISEAARVLPEHVDLQRRVILFETTKTGEWEPCHITQELLVRLANLPMTDAQPVFGYASRFGIYRRMAAVCRRAKLPWVPPHQAGRHSFFTEALARGATIREAMDAGRAKSARLMLETYTHAEEGGRRVAALFDTELAQPKTTTSEKSGTSKSRGAA